MTFVDEQTVKPRALFIAPERRERLGLPKTYRWYVECDRFAGWGLTLETAWRMWRLHRLERQAYKFRE